MNKITLVGLGISKGDVTVLAIDALKNAKKIICRTQNALSSSNLLEDFSVTFLDDVYKKSRNFDTLNKNLADAVISFAKKEDVCYAVDGSVYEDNSCLQILKKYKNVQVISGISAGAKCLERANAVSTNCTFCSAYDVKNGFKPTLPFVVYAIDSKSLASEIKLILSDYFGEESDVVFTCNKFTSNVKLYEIDRQSEYSYDVAIYFKELKLTEKTRFDFDDLLTIMQALRSPNGCPWDKVQTKFSVQKNLIEECYELIDAINSGDESAVIEEIGDVLLQTAFQIQFAKEEKSFTKSDVISAICNKLISRHTHVFGKDVASDEFSALETWNKNKAIEKGYSDAFSYVDSVPRNLPAIMRAQKVGSRAGKSNFDFETYKDALSKLLEEASEVVKACDNSDESEIEKECGDLLFSAVNVVRKLGVDGETALYKAVDKFCFRFKKLEQAILKDGKNLETMTSKEIDGYYLKIKEEV